MSARRLGLAGLPGSGKDTTLHHLVSALALRPDDFDLLAVGDAVKRAAGDLISAANEGQSPADVVSEAEAVLPVRPEGRHSLESALADLTPDDLAAGSGHRRSEEVRRLLQVMAGEAVAPSHWNRVIYRFCDQAGPDRWLFVNGVRRVAAADALRERGFVLVYLHLEPERCAARLDGRDGRADRRATIGHGVEWEMCGYHFDYTVEVWDDEHRRERSPDEVAEEVASVLRSWEPADRGNGCQGWAAGPGARSEQANHEENDRKERS